MKNKFVSILFPFLPLLLKSTDQNQKSITLLYTGDELKAYPIVILYLPGSIDTEYDKIRVNKFEISEEGFKQVIRSAQESKDPPASATVRSPS